MQPKLSGLSPSDLVEDRRCIRIQAFNRARIANKALFASSHCQSEFPVEPVNLFMIDSPAFSAVVANPVAYTVHMPRKNDKECPALSKEELRLLALKAYENAVELVEDAELLFANSRFSRCLFLSQIAGEELGKCYIALTAIPVVVQKSIDWPHFWSRFRHHKNKLTSVHAFEDLMLSEQLPDMAEIQRQVAVMDLGKMRALYSDVLEEKGVIHTCRPSELWSEALVSNFLGWAKNRLALYSSAVLPLLQKDVIDSLNPETLKVRVSSMLPVLRL